MISIEDTEASEPVIFALGEIERMAVSETAFDFEDVVARLRNQKFTADIVPLRRDECVCGEN